MDISNTKALYEGLPFPLRAVEDESFRLITPPPDHLGRLNHYCFAGRNNFTSDFRALVAGGGTGDAVVYLAEQLSKRGYGRVTYIDQSAASMDIAMKRAAARGLNNIDWLNGSLLEVGPDELGEFDYINCVGVIHHLDTPIRGLEALSSVLKNQGVLCLMVYGRYGRQDITDARDIFQTYLKASSPEHLLSDAQVILSSLSPRNSYMRGRDREYVLSTLFEDLPNLADIFLNPVECTYSADEFAELVEDGAGLHINRFTSYDGSPAIMNYQYDPALLVASEAVRSSFRKLSVREQWKIAEILDGSMHLHCAYVSKTATTSADFTDNDLVPFFLSEQQSQVVEIICGNENHKIEFLLSNGAKFPVEISSLTASFLRCVNNSDTIQKILIAIKLDQSKAQILLNDLRFLAEMDLICLRAESVKPFMSIDNGIDCKAAQSKNGELKYEYPVIHKS